MTSAPPAQQRPTQQLALLYHEDVRLRIDESGKLKAGKLARGKLTPEQREVIRAHSTAFRRLLEWNEPMAEKMAVKACRIAYGEYQPDGEELEEAREATQEAHTLYNEGFFKKDMGLVRYACWLHVKSVKTVRAAWERG